MKIYEKEFQKYRAEWRKDPVRFFKDVFDKAKQYEHQFEILRSLAQYRKVAVRSGHGIGKDAVAAIVIWWFLVCFDYPRIPCTASTASQLESVLWGELRKWHRRMGMPQWIASQYEVLDAVARNKEEKDWWAKAITARKGEEQALAGIHEDNVLIILDEASEISDKTIETLFGSLSGANVYVLAIGNPVKYSGFFYELFNGRHKMFHCLHYDGEIISQKHPELVSPDLISYYETYGRDSDVFRYRVKGEFPRQGARQLISIDALHKCYGRNVATTGELVVIVDVARYGGDKTVVGILDGRVLELHTKFEKTSVPETTARIKKLITELEDSYKLVARIIVDEIGVGGGVLDLLREKYDGRIHVEGFIGNATYLSNGRSKRPIKLDSGRLMSDEYLNLRSYSYALLAKAIEQGQISLPEDRDLENQLLNIPYDYKGKVMYIPSKESLRKGVLIEDRLYKLPRSPDEADVCAMALSPLAITGDREAFNDPFVNEEDDPDYGIDYRGRRIIQTKHGVAGLLS